MRRFFLSILLPIAALLPVHDASAFQAGWRQIGIPDSRPGAPTTTVALYYPTQTPARAVPMGPFTPRVAPGAEPEPVVKGLIVLSHGTGGSELGHGRLAEALAEHGYLVAALRHPRDNWQDQSALAASPGAYFDERPRQVSRVIDALLRDPQWKDRIASDARGPKVGAIGHSAGGYTVVALAGGEPDLSRIVRHCEVDRADDAIFCATGRSGQSSTQPTAAVPAGPPLVDRRVRAVAALAPVGVVFTAQSLAAIRLPVVVYAADQDRWLATRFHAEWIARNVPGAELRRVRNAWHFAFMDTPGMAIDTPDGDIRADPPGFDRPAFLGQLARELVLFFDQGLRLP